jgi:hypothetical protein
VTTTYSPGNYQAEVLDQGYEESSSKGTPGFFLQLKIRGRYGPDGQLGECPQYERTYIQYIGNEAGVRILKSDLKVLGIEITDLAQLVPGSHDHISLVGRTIDVVCKQETYQGRPRERWSIPRSRKKLDMDAIRSLGDQFGHLLRDGKAQAASSPAVTQPNDSDSAF